MMKVNSIIIVLLLLVAMFVASCAPQPAVSPSEPLVPEESGLEDTTEQQVEYIRITAAEAKEMIDSGDVAILDVRTVEEFEAGHIEDALLIPDFEIENLAEEILTDKDAVILVYCRTGRRSEIASRKLIDLGYTRVYDFGGIVDWPYEVVTENGS